MGDNTIIGWQLEKGGGKFIDLTIGEKYPNEIILFRAHPDVVPGAPITKVLNLDIWGLDPRLTLIVQFYHRLRFGGPISGAFPMGGSSGTIKTYPIVRPQNPEDYVRILTEIPAVKLFNSGGFVNDGCEISSGMQGIRFEVTGTITTRTDHDIVASIQVKPNVALGCVSLAEALIARMFVEVPAPIIFEP